LLPNFIKTFKSAKTYLEKYKLLVDKEIIENDLNDLLFTGEIYDKKYHIGSFLKIGEDKENAKINILQKNISTNQEIKFNDEQRVLSQYKYEYIKNIEFSDKYYLQSSFETPFLHKTVSIVDLINTTKHFNDVIEIKSIIKKHLYPGKILLDLIKPCNNQEIIIYKDNSNSYQFKNYEIDFNLLNTLVKIEQNNSIVVYKDIKEYNEFCKYLFSEIDYLDFSVIYKLDLLEKLDKDKKTLI